MIIINNEKALRKICSDVSSLDEAHNIIALLEKELTISARMGRPGIGLAAPQIGITKNVAIVRLGRELNLNLVNCKITKMYDSFIFQNEGCLSFPGKNESTRRFQEIYVQSNLVEPHSFIATGMLAVCCQHELEHLIGKIFYDSSIKRK